MWRSASADRSLTETRTRSSRLHSHFGGMRARLGLGLPDGDFGRPLRQRSAKRTCFGRHPRPVPADPPASAALEPTSRGSPDAGLGRHRTPARRNRTCLGRHRTSEDSRSCFGRPPGNPAPIFPMHASACTARRQGTPPLRRPLRQPSTRGREGFEAPALPIGTTPTSVETQFRRNGRRPRRLRPAGIPRRLRPPRNGTFGDSADLGLRPRWLRSPCDSGEARWNAPPGGPPHPGSFGNSGK